MSCPDPYLPRRSALHNLDPRAKLLAVTAFITALVLTPAASWMPFGLYLLFVLALAVAARLPAPYLLRRIAVTLPFILPAVLFIPFLHGGEALVSLGAGGWQITLSRPGLELATTILAKAWLSVTALSILIASTRLSDITRGLEKLHVPGVLPALLGFTFRYYFVLTEEAHRLKAGRDVRYFSRRTGPGIRSVGYMAGSLFLRSYARGERVYDAMLLRGYDGISRSLNPLRFRPADAVFLLGVLAAIIVINVARSWL